MALSDKIIASVDPANIRKNSNLGKIAKRRGVSKTADFMRIQALPRRVWEEAGDLEELRVTLTEALRPEHTTLPKEELFHLLTIQAAALREVHDQGGGFLPISVGGGKALISLLIPVVLNAKRPMLFVPADLREQTNRKVIPEMKNHFKLHPDLRVVGYSEISLAKNKDMLEEYEPDVIIFDEGHALKSVRAGRTRRVRRYMKTHPDTIVVILSGTISNRSLKDYQHLAQWCLGIDNAPLPAKFNELSEWADALDDGVADHARMAPGALSMLCDPGENARQGYRRRLTETPGVIASGAEELDVSLRINRLDPQTPGKVSRMLGVLRDQWEDPNGAALSEAVDVWRVARQLALGFWYQWQPPAPREWIDARRVWKKYVRETIRHNRRGLDTELQVWNEMKTAIQTGEASGEGVIAWHDWRAVKDTFKPNPVPVWEDTFAVDAVSNWVDKGPGIVWVEHRAVGERLGKDLGIPYFGAGKKASLEILDAAGPVVASIAAHGQGKNLQQWNRNLVTAPSSSGKTWEQKMGRTHRFGQKADTVSFDVFLHDQSLEDSFRKALAAANYLEDTLGGRQRLNYADITFEV